MNTVAENAPLRAWPQVQVSVTRAAGFPDMNTPCLSFEASGEANERSGGRQPLNPVSKGCDVSLWERACSRMRWVSQPGS
jgi:hypothetical protein